MSNFKNKQSLLKRLPTLHGRPFLVTTFDDGAPGKFYEKELLGYTPSNKNVTDVQFSDGNKLEIKTITGLKPVHICKLSANKSFKYLNNYAFNKMKDTLLVNFEETDISNDKKQVIYTWAINLYGLSRKNFVNALKFNDTSSGKVEVKINYKEFLSCYKTIKYAIKT